MLSEEHERKIKMYYLSGGNFLETMPDPNFVEKALSELEIRVHQDIILNTSTLLMQGKPSLSFLRRLVMNKKAEELPLPLSEWFISVRKSRATRIRLKKLAQSGKSILI
ncbi:formate dehydrogenase oxidoreductase protein [Mesobacillus boroniphilus JCM 21738]|uniref:Formate dehydrogenase oxidoreductase protein n=1 Tax=Mesobacillus boroniphilus JCM 21738 TaxID=1294265 RepID=W4RRE8_9BACI|nr:formate dehydrogenase oxidoreductase protein [Mesobacillus boroniphilus JCM 21738]